MDIEQLTYPVRMPDRARIVSMRMTPPMLAPLPPQYELRKVLGASGWFVGSPVDVVTGDKLVLVNKFLGRSVFERTIEVDIDFQRP